MTLNPGNAVPKTHPATRQMMPEDPLELTAFEVAGDPDLMLRMLVEEYARLGWDTAAIMRLARNAWYPGFHGLLKLHGEAELGRRISAILAQCGVTRVKTVETHEERPEVVQLTLPEQRSRPTP